jgi:enamine deaminase RidA (YjgF/YER057c/UK114 family)
MTTNSRTAEDRLAKLGIQLPDAPTPFGAYVPAVQTGNLLFLSGKLASSGHKEIAFLRERCQEEEILCLLTGICQFEHEGIVERDVWQ